MVEDAEKYISPKFCQNPFIGCGGEVENISANQRPGQPYVCLRIHPKHKWGREHRELATR